MSEAKLQLLGVLREATSQDYQRMRQAEDMLKQWENAPSFFATLQVIKKKVTWNARPAFVYSFMY